MKKELFAAITIVLLLLGAACNILQIKKLSESMSSHLQAATQACNSNNFDAAETELSNALNLWLHADSYTHIFIRHSEIDSATDAFYEALSNVQSEHESSVSAIEKIKYHLDSIYAMEKITFKSVF